MHDDLRLDLMHRIVEVQCAEALLGRLLEVFKDALIAWVVRNDQLKIGVRRDQFIFLVQRQHASIVGQRMNDHGGILARLDYLATERDTEGT